MLDILKFSMEVSGKIFIDIPFFGIRGGFRMFAELRL